MGLYLRRARLQVAVGRERGRRRGHRRCSCRRSPPARPLAEEAALVSTSYWDLKADLLRELYEFNRAYTYWSLVDRPFVASDSTIADLASAYVAWTNDIDTFSEQSGPVQPFEEQIELTRGRLPRGVRLLVTTRTLNVVLDLRAIAPTSFAAMTHIVATKVGRRPAGHPPDVGSGAGRAHPQRAVRAEQRSRPVGPGQRAHVQPRPPDHSVQDRLRQPEQLRGRFIGDWPRDSRASARSRSGTSRSKRPATSGSTSRKLHGCSSGSREPSCSGERLARPTDAGRPVRGGPWLWITVGLSVDVASREFDAL